MEPDDLLCSRNARSLKGRRKGVRSFLCSRSARHPKGLARRPQSKAPQSLAWLALKWRSDASGCAQWEIKQTTLPEGTTSELGGSMRVVRCAQLRISEDALPRLRPPASPSLTWTEHGGARVLCCDPAA